MCVHDKYNFDKLFEVTGRETWFALIDDFMDSDRFPEMEDGCTDVCKEKMIKLTQYIFKNYMNSVCWYYHDVKIKDNMRNSCYTFYCSSINEKREPENFNYTPQLEKDSSFFPDYPNVLKENNK
ncbi:hypothetical protein DICPUDRAFT_155721 [Dictyostelium purpureum]|uniref:Uncharacterized protein n=1 Tax=Dictyostelium purpureum TaxID=5786 RepID=F0ZUQ2_DICPU|nr:uncharacterized protein DICPUDRAFT_155721 [Dictyostelium purpureum]EGC32338.1 hypothetical protein DICPUDRAFT_155721 [Dictyostelium purpureum]|eukprot:XP_003291140.1 hypothetical protein DICPUDRAFT_155721 [Dictyostelium purpureum]